MIFDHSKLQWGRDQWIEVPILKLGLGHPAAISRRH